MGMVAAGERSYVLKNSLPAGGGGRMTAGFSTAPADDRVLSVGAYLVGFAELAVIRWPSARGRQAAATLLGGWSGAPALLCDPVIGVTALVLVSEALGTVSAFGEIEMIVASLVFAGVAAWASGRIAAGLPDAAVPPALPAGSLAIGRRDRRRAVVAAAWMVPTLGTLAGGMDRADTLWYHMPLAAKFVQTGSLGASSSSTPSSSPRSTRRTRRSSTPSRSSPSTGTSSRRS